MPFFTSERERRLWLWTLAVVAAIYSTLGQTAALAGILRDRGLLEVSFILGVLLVAADGRVTFRYRATGIRKAKTCTLPAHEFMRRFLQHVLPKGFVKVRYYGHFSSAYRAQLARLHQALGADPPEPRDQASPSTQPAPDAPASPFHLCPTCGQPMLGRTLPPVHRTHPP